MPPSFGGYFILTLFTQFTGSPRRLSLTKPPFIGYPPAIANCEFGDELAATCQAIDSFCDGGLEPPQSIVDSLSSLSRELVDARRISSDLHGAIRPPSQRPGVSSHQQRFAAAAAGPSMFWRQPYAFASDQPTSNSSGRPFRPGG